MAASRRSTSGPGAAAAGRLGGLEDPVYTGSRVYLSGMDASRLADSGWRPRESSLAIWSARWNAKARGSWWSLRISRIRRADAAAGRPPALHLETARAAGVPVVENDAYGELRDLRGRSAAAQATGRTRRYGAAPQFLEGELSGFTSGSFGDGPALAVVRPGTLVDGGRVLNACIAAGKIVIMQAANTGLKGGSTPDGDQYDRDIVIISDNALLDKIHLIDDGRQVVLAGRDAVRAREEARSSRAKSSFRDRLFLHRRICVRRRVQQFRWRADPPGSRLYSNDPVRPGRRVRKGPPHQSPGNPAGRRAGDDPRECRERRVSAGDHRTQYRPILLGPRLSDTCPRSGGN